MQNTPMDLMSTLQIVGIVTATTTAVLWRKPLFKALTYPLAIFQMLMQAVLNIHTPEEAEALHERHEDQIRSMDAVVTALRDERRGWNAVHTALGKHIEDLQAQQRNRDERHNRLRREVENLGITARQLMDAAGGMTWKDRQGLVRGIVNLSDNHLETLLHEGWVNGEHADMVTQELERRNRDDQWHRKAGKTSPRETLAKLTEGKADKQAALDRGIPVHDEVAFDIETALGGLHIVPMGPVPKPIVTPPQAPTPTFDIDYSGLELRMIADLLFGRPKSKLNFQPMPTTGRTSSKPRIFTRDEATDSPDVPYLTERELELKGEGNYGIVPLTLNQRRAQAGNKVRIQDDPASLRRFLRHQARVAKKVTVAQETEMFRRLFMIPSMMRPESMCANGGAIDFNWHNTGFQSGGLTPKTPRDFTAYGRGAK